MSFLLTVIDEQGTRQINGEAGVRVFDLLTEQNIFLDAPCAGKGRCGKCRVQIEGAVNLITKQERSLLTEEELNNGIRLACECRIEGAAQIKLLQESGIIAQESGVIAEFTAEPAVRLIHVIVPKPDLKSQLPDDIALLGALQTAGHDCKQIAFSALKKLPILLRSHDFSINVVVCEDRVIDVLAPDDTACYGMAVDIGTTTVVAYFYDLTTAEKRYTVSGLNLQRAYGADVISRISAANDQEGRDKLQQAIVGQLNDFIARFVQHCGVSAESVYEITVAANTTMLHLLTGLDSSAIANAPFISASLFGVDVGFADLGLNGAKSGRVCLLPSISSYVGADITAGMVASGVHRTEKNTVYIDIGTNGEMAFGNQSGFLACSTAAGPAFEGAHIKYGTGGVEGAISDVWLEDGEICFSTIGDQPAIGICGSGLIDAVAVMLEIGAIDETGRLVDEDEIDERYLDRLTEDEFVIDPASGIAITAQDIRELQLAKAAIAAGINTMLHHAGKTIQEVDRVIVAGGFGSHIDRSSACKIGLLPASAEQRIEFVGNAAGMGAIQGLLSKQIAQEMQQLCKNVKYIELSGNAFFQDDYIEQMMFE